MKKNGFEDKRLLEAIDRIDSKYISEMLGYYDDLPAEGDATERDDLIYLEKLPLFDKDGEVISVDSSQ